MLSRRELLERGAAMTGGALALGRVPTAWATTPSPVAGMNILMFITDQERAIQHFPRGWSRRHLPGLTRLQRNGLTFENAFCNACMCSPTRATLLTGYFTAQHGVKYTLEDDMSGRRFPQVELPTNFKNVASVMAATDYHVVYKGKWHLSKPAAGDSDSDNWAPSDVDKYGFARWNPPDAGANQDLDQAGGGSQNNDGRFMNQGGSAAAGKEGVLQYLNSVAAHQQPFFMIVSLVNPHDVLFYPHKYRRAGYNKLWLKGEIGLPATIDESLATKPSAQRQFLRISQLLGRLDTHQKQRAYLNFYGNLMKLVDGYLVDVLDALEAQNLLENTLVIRTSDHGEMGLAHGGMRQKNFNVYEESLRVPLVYSNPRLWSKAQTSKVMVSHVDFLPTLASLVNAPRSARARWQGVDYSDHILRRQAPPPQDYVVFTYDDYQAGQTGHPHVKPPQHIISLRERRWKIAEYYDANGRVPSQWEMYDLRNDPLERSNLAHKGYKRTPAQEKQYRRLQRKLARVKAQRLRPLPNTPKPKTHGSPSRPAPRSAMD
jgi:arylsulfatase A-like enzyme